ncbi:MAG: hypothetical protein WDW36_009876 [Sanguina aurantia]
MPPYSQAAYWNSRYERELAAFEWHMGFSPLSELMEALWPQRNVALLQIGVGTSCLQEGMVQAGYVNSITNLDTSEVLVSHMAMLHKAIPQLSYVTGNARAMPEQPSSSFDGVVDKGCLDAVLCGERLGGHQVVQECHRVLRPGGVYLMISHSEPQARLQFLITPLLPWEVTVYVIGKQDAMDGLNCLQDEVYYVYVCKTPLLEPT